MCGVEKRSNWQPLDLQLDMLLITTDPGMECLFDDTIKYLQFFLKNRGLGYQLDWS